MDKPIFRRRCPDCRKLYYVDVTYTDEAYLAHKRGEESCVCGPCFDKFNGLTLEELVGQPPLASGEHNPTD